MEKANDMEKLRTVYYIVAPTSSGKTTSARRLSKEMGLPLVHADHAYNALAKKYNATCSPAKLTEYELWDKPEEFGIESWGVHASMHDAKREIYCDLIKNISGDFIIEGFTLSFISERELIEDVIGRHRSVIVRIKASFDQWCELYISKNNDKDVVRRVHAFNRLTECFTAKPDDFVIAVSHPREVNFERITSALKESRFKY